MGSRTAKRRAGKVNTGTDSAGFSLVELVVVIAILAVLLGVLTPSLNVLPGFRVRRAASNIGTALERTKTEALNRLVGEMRLYYVDGEGYYVSYYLDEGKSGGKADVQEVETERIASTGVKISYTDSDEKTYNLWETGSSGLILTYDRPDGSFLPIQEKVWTQSEILTALQAGKDIPLTRDGAYCTKITLQSGSSVRVITLNRSAGTYEITKQ